MFESLKKAPFNLNQEALKWVEQTFADLTVKEKIGQLLNVCSFTDDLESANRFLAFAPGGITRIQAGDMQAARAATRHFVANSKVPPLISGDIEGGVTSFAYGTDFPDQLGLAAADDPDLTARVATALAVEAKAMGYNWSFTPIIDINLNYRSAITGTRSFGSDVATIERHSQAYIDAWQQQGMAACAKHWPGDGVDDRDQHLVTSVNSLPMAKWRDSYGRLYSKVIDAGVMTIMSAHIALPAYIRERNPGAELEAYRPATVSKALNLDLLRGELGFNGLIVSDATPMAGLTSWQSREITAPEIIENGCDMFLFNDSVEMDFRLLENGLSNGLLSEQRLNEAVARVLGLKAALGLHRQSVTKWLPDDAAAVAVLQDSAHQQVSAEAAARSVTLVKDTQNLLPLSPQKHRRVLLITEGIARPMRPDSIPFAFIEQLKQAGFEVTLLSEHPQIKPEEFNLVMYLFGVESMAARSHIYIDWTRLHGGAIRGLNRYWHQVPTLMISFGHPYYLYDAPRVPTYINAYSSTTASQNAVLKALLGESAFTAGNPVDPFCGLEDARY